MMAELLVFLTAGWMISYIGMHGMIRLFLTYGWVAYNYEGKAIPLGYGAVLAFSLLLFMGIGIAIDYNQNILFVAGGAMAASLSGWIDDRFGQGEAKGIRGHVQELWRNGRISTGLMKAAVIGGCAILVASRTSSACSSFIAHSLLLMLGANFINLLDVRPGRALKGFWFIQFLCIGIGVIAAEMLPLFLYVFVCTLASAAFDFSRKAMLGDTGANLLGFLGGAFCIYSFGSLGEWVLVTLLIALHLYTEQVSLTAVIEKHPLLHRIDGWGRFK
ncbi:hypothetical protein [Aneurinibacillus sp. REN35]|uniref:hypothetical protein n=1 Tax=Aneurinibacillus sp. REN35 TaxID=3237286 RepID=UPI003528EC99